MGWTNNQEYLLRYIYLYQDLMLFWKEKLGNFIYEINYETLVNNQTEETKKVLDFCNLDFENNCLNFSKNSSPTKTISNAQARKEIYKRTINLSNKYLEYFPFLKKV